MRNLPSFRATAVASFLLALPFSSALAQSSGTQMLPPTQAGTTAPCAPGSSALLTMADSGVPGSNKSAINCVSNATLSGTGNLSTAGAGNFGGNLNVGGNLNAVGTTVFPPTNAAAGGGLLFFPQGGSSSLYAVPVLADPALISAVASQTSAIKAQTAAMNQDAVTIAMAINGQAVALQNLATLLGGTITGGSGGAGGNGGSGACYASGVAYSPGATVTVGSVYTNVPGTTLPNVACQWTCQNGVWGTAAPSAQAQSAYNSVNQWNSNTVPGDPADYLTAPGGEYPHAVSGSQAPDLSLQTLFCTGAGSKPN